MMNQTDKRLCALYAGLATFALIGTWSHNIAFMLQTHSLNILDFIHAATNNHAATSIALDITVLCLVLFTFMLNESKKYGIKFTWVYILGSITIAVSVCFPLFLIARQIKIAQSRTLSPN